MKNFVFWDVALCDCCKKRRFGGTSVFKTAIRRNISEDGILHSQRLETHRCYIYYAGDSTKILENAYSIKAYTMYLYKVTLTSNGFL
jgi:hypothetical protein